MKKVLLSLVMALVSCVMVMAQVTTSSMSGKVFDDVEELIGATVMAVHEPSGTTYGAVTNASGAFSLEGMRVGGPYTVKVSYVGYQTKTFTDVVLALGEDFNLNVTLSSTADQLEEVIVVGSASKFAGQVKTGASLNINNSMMSNMPTVSRSLSDIARLSPYAGASNSFAGGDGRSTNFTIDGANFNNNFGLSSSLPGGGNPVSLDAIEEVQVVVAPFDVRQTNFIGGGINAVTKSGTNTFKGTAYTYYRDQQLRGNRINGEDLGVRSDERLTTYGFTLGGPILKNKLFFFVNFERSLAPGSPIKYHAKGSNGSGTESACTIEDMNTVKDILINKYGYDPGSATDFAADEENTKLLARLDWNITNDHHLSLRYSSTKNKAWNAPNGNSCDAGTRDRTTNRVGETSMAFSKSMYSQDNDVQSWSATLNSRFGNNISNELMFTYTDIKDMRGTDSEAFPFIDIMNGENHHYMSAGYELFTYNNGVKNRITSIKDDFRYKYGNHNFLAGFSYEHQYANNAYMRNATGYYRFANLEDFINCKPEAAAICYGFNGVKDPNAQVTFNQVGYYLQDEWTLNPTFKLTYGVRFDHMLFDNKDIATNKAIYALEFNGQKVDTGKWPGNNVQISPRVGFTWDVKGDRSLTVRGGTGLFAGRLPLVFFTNMPTNGGMVQYQAQVNAKNAAAKGFTMDTFAGGLVTKDGKATIEALKDKLFSLGYPQTIKPEDGTVPSAVNGVDPNFKMPQVWKTTLAVDYSLPTDFPLSATAEGIFNKTINGVSISDWSIPNVGGFARFNGADNRPLYPAGYRTGTKAFVLENTSRGYGWSGNITLNAQPTKNISLMAAYTHTVTKEVTGMPGSAAESAFTYVPTSEGPNNIKLHNSQYATPDRIVANASIHDNSGNHYSIIYETWRGGYNYSYMTTNDMNGDGYNYDALYIPTDDQVKNGQFRFVSEDDKNRFMDYVHKDDYLSNHQGEYAEAYYKHDFKLDIKNTTHKLQLSFDIKNMANLFNNKWGVSKYLNPAIGSEARILKYEGVDADGYATFSTPSAINKDTQTFVPNHAIGQCWYMSIGVKYIFN